MANSQHRCVFVGNIPYDATEEQLKQICEEVGPVVSFRLVSDRETGKPKGYGFCEYRDEETALSARRNLQGYEINGRQLRVDFAENDKGVDRNREQGRGGPGFASNFDSQKQSGTASAGDPSLNQPVGLAVAAAAASVMTAALGDPHASLVGQNQNSVQGQSNLSGNDHLTTHLASLSKNQLWDVMSEMKTLIQQNQHQARDILTTNPKLAKALFQAQIMLGMVPSHMLPHFRQSSNLTGQLEPSTQSGQRHSGQSQMQPGQQNQMQIGQHGQISVKQSQPSNNTPIQQLMQPPQHIATPLQMHVIQQPQPQITQSLLQSVQPESQGPNLPVQSSMHSPPHSTLMQPLVSSILSSQSQQPSIQPTLGIIHQLPLPQQPRPSLQSFLPPTQVQSLSAQSLGFQSMPLHQLPLQVPFQQLGNIPTTMGMAFQKHSQPPLPNRPPPVQSYQMGSGSEPGVVSQVVSDVTRLGTGQSNLTSAAGILSIGPVSAVQGGRGSNLIQGSSSTGPDLSWTPGLPPSGTIQFSTVPSGMGELAGICGDWTTGMAVAVGPPSIDDGNRAYSAVNGASGEITSGTSDRIASSPAHSPSQMPVEGMPHAQQQVSQGMQLPPEMNSLLQQVMSLTQEQINSLPLEQRQQVLQLQQTLHMQQTFH